VEPAAPVAPVEPADPVAPVDPVAPGAPVAPGGPAGPISPEVEAYVSLPVESISRADWLAGRDPGKSILYELVRWASSSTWSAVPMVTGMVCADIDTHKKFLATRLNLEYYRDVPGP